MEEHGTPPPAEEIRSMSAVFRLLAKARKALQLYENDNEIPRRLEESLTAAAGDHLAKWGSCELSVLEAELRLGGATVYRSDGRTDNLAFLLFRDGIRQLVVLPGIDRGELHDLLTALNRVSRGDITDEDLVTMFWDLDFQHIRYVAIETLTDQTGTARVEDQLASETTDGNGTAGGVDPKELQKPVAQLPIEACMLTEMETDQLKEQLAAEVEEDPLREIVELAVDLTWLSREDEVECERLALVLAARLTRTSTEAGAGELIRAVGFLDDLAETEFSECLSVANLQIRVLEELSRPHCVAAILDATDAREFPSEALCFLLIRLGDPALHTIISKLAEIKSDELRRVAAKVIHASGRAGVQHLLRSLESGGFTDPQLVRAVLPVVGMASAEDGVAIVERMLTVPDLALRRQAARELGPYREGAPGSLWLRLLDDDDEQMRMQAVSALVRGGRAAAAQHLMSRVIEPHFATRSAEEKRHLMVGIGRLARDRSLRWFEQLFQRTDAGIFASRSNRELVRAAADGLRAVGTQESRSLLGKLARIGDRHVRAACREPSATTETRA
jgi:hypothetical protein